MVSVTTWASAEIVVSGGPELVGALGFADFLLVVEI
jgi:hypothetical protein